MHVCNLPYEPMESEIREARSKRRWPREVSVWQGTASIARARGAGLWSTRTWIDFLGCAGDPVQSCGRGSPGDVLSKEHVENGDTDER